jgi:hypothetical protein
MPEPIALFLALLMQRPPDLEGLMTWYGIDDGSGVVFRDGTRFDLAAPACAVDDGVWLQYRGLTAFVQADDRLFACTIRDSGWLDEAGTFDGESVVLDVPHDTFVAMTGDEETKGVRIWIQ